MGLQAFISLTSILFDFYLQCYIVLEFCLLNYFDDIMFELDVIYIAEILLLKVLLFFFFWPGFCFISFRFCDCTYDSALECLVCEHKVLGSISYVEHDIIKERNKKKLQNQCHQFYFSVTSEWLHGKAWLDKVYGNYNMEGKQS